MAGEVLGGELDDKFEKLLKSSEHVRKNIEAMSKNERDMQDNLGWAKMKEGIDQIIRSRLLEKDKSIMALK